MLSNSSEFVALSTVIGNVSNSLSLVLTEQTTQNNRLTALENISYQLNDLTDVNINNSISGNVLYYDGTNWINQTLNLTTTLDSLTNVQITNLVDG